MENNGYDTAEWDELDDNGTLIDPGYFSTIPPIPEGMGYLGLDSLDAHDFLKIDDSDDLDFDNENIGISVWIYPTKLANVNFILNKGVQDSDPKTTNYAIRNQAGKLEFLIRDAFNQAQTATSDIDIVSGVWIFFAVYYDYNAKKVYFWNQQSGTPNDTVDFDQDYFSNEDPLLIGSWFRNDTSSSSIRDFEGYMDDVRISGRLEDILTGISSTRSHDGFQINKISETISIYPNPVSISNGNNHIKFRINSSTNSEITYTIYNILGQRIFKGRSNIPGSEKKIQWEMKDTSGNMIRTGIYFVEFKGLQNRVVKKFLVVK
jgi:hypothetical protein